MLRSVVFVRHGESEGNKENIYTGWADHSLSVKGEQEAVEAGLCLKGRCYKFDVVFTSALSRATKTAELIRNISGNAAVPVVQSWRLNARHSGALQGLTQDQAVAKFGEANVTLWRSSYDILPACVAEDDPRHPVNDARYADVPRELLPPGGESLAHTVDRVVPLWKESIAPRIAAGESVLIVGHKNSFRALWKFLESIPDEDALDIKMSPASAPVVFQFQQVEKDGGLVFSKKFSLNAPKFNPKHGPSTEAKSRVFFLRHGESVGNAKNLHGGWEDAALTAKGEQQAIQAGLYLKENGIKIDAIFVSVLQRAVKTAELACTVSGNAFAVPVVKSWRLNPMHSGVFSGLTHEDCIAMYGEDSVNLWQESEDHPPLCMKPGDPRHPVNDPLYADIPRDELPGGESFSQVSKRVTSFWNSDIVPLIAKGRSLMVVAHKTSLLAIKRTLQTSEDDAIVLHETTLPIVYEFGVDASGGLAVKQKYSLSAMHPQYGLVVRPVGKVVFLRHGESLCNLKGAFTGWEDTGLTPKGVKEAEQAAGFLKDEGLKFDVVFTSVLHRAVESVRIICQNSDNKLVPVIKSWRLNARHPGVIQGLTKAEANELYGAAKVDLWRGSYDFMPQCVETTDPRHPVNDPLYKDVPPHELPPGGESLKRTVDRIVPYWQSEIAPRVKANETVLVVGHKNSLKALFMYLEDTPQHNMFDLRPVSSKAPLVFEFGDDGYSSGLNIVKKYWVKHTPAEALAASRCKDGSMHM